MSSNYTGDRNATQSPASPPVDGVPPEIVLPSDGDALNAASVAQMVKVLADYLAFEQAPLANGGQWAQKIRAYRNALDQTRALISHPGFVEGKVLSWQEDWQDVAFIAGKTAVGNGIFGGRWHYSISGDAVGGGISSEFPPMCQ